MKSIPDELIQCCAVVPILENKIKQKVHGKCPSFEQPRDLIRVDRGHRSTAPPFNHYPDTCQGELLRGVKNGAD